MSTRIRQHIRSNVYGLIAIFIALGGTAYATHPGGDNTIDSVDIITEEVKTADIAPAAVTIGRVALNSINSGKVINNSLTGADIDESTLGAPSGSIGRWQGGTACDPESTTFIDCGFVTLNLPSQSRVLISGAVGARPRAPAMMDTGRAASRPVLTARLVHPR